MRTEESVIELIRKAFQNVTLGNGYGLRKAESWDFGGEGYTEELFQLDEKEKAAGWQSLKAEDLDKYHVALSFFDPEGMRFHLPAYMIYELKDVFEYVSVIFHLTYIDDEYSLIRFSLLNHEQRNAVREYLLLLRDMEIYEFYYPHIDLALELYWTADTE